MPSLRGGGAVIAPPRRPPVDDPSILAFHRDLAAPYGSAVDEDLLRAAPHVSHRDLVDLLAGTDELRAARPDLIILAFALPDIHPFTMVGPHLNMLYGDRATSFGISQQGLAAPFTALRAIDRFQRGGRSRQALLAVLEQTTLPTYHPLTHDTPLRDSAAGLLLDTGDADTGDADTGGGLRLAGTETVAFGVPVHERLSQLTAAYAPGDTLLVLGPWAEHGGATATAPPPVHRVEPGSYCTSVWLALAQNWRTWQERYGSVVLCDTDPRTGRTHLAVLHGSPDRDRARRRPAAAAAGG